MSWPLRESPDAPAAGAARVARATGIPMAHVDKGLLGHRGAARRRARRRHGGQRRVQGRNEPVEDVRADPTVLRGRRRDRHRARPKHRKDDRCLKSFVAAAEAATGLKATIDDRTATKGVKRTARLEYPTNSAMGAMWQSWRLCPFGGWFRRMKAAGR